MLRKIKIIVVLFFISQGSLFAQQSFIGDWRTGLLKSIQLEIEEFIQVNCKPRNEASMMRFFETELNFFPIKESFELLQNFQDSLVLKKNDRLILRLYYPQVGFDPELGYYTNVLVKRKFCKTISKEFDPETKVFKSSSFKYKDLKKERKGNSGCFGSGYLFISIFDRHLKLLESKILLAI